MKAQNQINIPAASGQGIWMNCPKSKVSARSEDYKVNRLKEIGFNKLKKILFVFLLFNILLGCNQEKTNMVVEDPKGFGLRFWVAFSGAELLELGKFHSSQVVILKGSELLKQQWNLNLINGQTELSVITRDDLIETYGVMINKVGGIKWEKIFSQVKLDRIQFEPVDIRSSYYKSAKEGDVVMLVPTGKFDDRLVFVLSLDEGNNWLISMTAIIMEARY